jgi:hypothetical protein
MEDRECSNAYTSNSVSIAGIDSDNDGMPDAYEEANGLNPLVNDAGEDPDNDGWPSLAEFQDNQKKANDGSDHPILSELIIGGAGADDANLGDSAHPLATLHGAVARVNSMAEGDYTIQLGSGLFDLNAEPDEPLAPVHNVTFIGDGATIDGDGAAVWTTGLTIPVGAADVTVEGVSIKNFKHGIALSSDGGCLNLTGVSISGCEESGLLLAGTFQSDIDLNDSTISGCKAGIKVAGGSSGNTLRNGEVTNNTDGIRLEGDADGPDDNRFDGIDVTFNTENGILILDGSGNVITGCFIYGNNTGRTGYGGIAVFAGKNEVVDSSIDQNDCYGV